MTYSAGLGRMGNSVKCMIRSNLDSWKWDEMSRMLDKTHVPVAKMPYILILET